MQNINPILFKIYNLICFHTNITVHPILYPLVSFLSTSFLLLFRRILACLSYLHLKNIIGVPSKRKRKKEKNTKKKKIAFYIMYILLDGFYIFLKFSFSFWINQNKHSCTSVILNYF